MAKWPFLVGLSETMFGKSVDGEHGYPGAKEGTEELYDYRCPYSHDFPWNYILQESQLYAMIIIPVYSRSI